MAVGSLLARPVNLLPSNLVVTVLLLKSGREIRQPPERFYRAHRQAQSARLADITTLSYPVS